MNDWSIADVWERLGELREHERELAQMIMAGFVQREIAKSLGVSQPTVHRRIKALGPRFPE